MLNFLPRHCDYYHIIANPQIILPTFGNGLLLVACGKILTKQSWIGSSPYSSLNSVNLENKKSKSFRFPDVTTKYSKSYKYTID